MTRNVFTVRLSDDVKAELEKLAEATNRSKSYLAAKAIEDYVRQNAWQIRELEQAVKEADAGDFVSEEAVYSWLDSWGREHELSPPINDKFKKNS